MYVSSKTWKIMLYVVWIMLLGDKARQRPGIWSILCWIWIIVLIYELS